MLMCNKGIPCLSQSENLIDQQYYCQSPYSMDSPTTISTSGPGSAPGSAPGSNDGSPHVKFLCSFLGNVMPRPQDGKLRYVGGETRIMSVARDIGYEELMSKMRELYEGAALLKYQQPDEDLDALVSVVNDDDVINMMEEYDKLGSGDGFTRLRIFLFSHPDQDGSSLFINGDERDTEMRYVDALNNLNDASDFRRQHPDYPVISQVDDVHAAEQFSNPISLDGGLHSQRSGEIPMPPYDLHHLTIPHLGSGQNQQPLTQRYNDMEAPWSPSYYSPTHHGHHDPRSFGEFPSSPSAMRYRMPFAELPDKCMDRMPEEYTRQQVNHQPIYEHQSQYSENFVWFPPGTISSERSGFPGNILHGPNALEGNSILEHCHINFQRRHPHLEHPNMGNGLPQVANGPCPQCPSNRENFMLNADAKLHSVIYPNDQNNEHRLGYNDTQNHERAWQHPMNAQVEEARGHVSGTGRLKDHYIVDGLGISIPLGHGNLSDGHHVSSNYLHPQAGPELGNEVFLDQTVAAAPHLHIPPPEEHAMRYATPPYSYGGDNHYPVSHGHAPGHALWRYMPTPVHIGQSYEVSSPSMQMNGTISPRFIRGDGSPRFCTGGDTPNSFVEPSQRILGFDGTAISEYPYAHALKLNPNTIGQENLHPLTLDPIHSSPDKLVSTSLEPLKQSESSSNLVQNKEFSLTTFCQSESRTDTNAIEAIRHLGGETQTKNFGNDENSSVLNNSPPEQRKVAEKYYEATAPIESTKSSHFNPAEESGDIKKMTDRDLPAPPEEAKLSVEHFSFLPDLIASVKRAALEGVEEVKAKAEEHADSQRHDSEAKGATANELEAANAHGDLESESDNDNLNTSKIECTKAEEEAISRGLQTIRNDDLEEIRELGSGTYGAVYHGKWKGSNVAIKRIKASCFAGRPLERERLIADFWKEALILSSLHHPNVVSFYGIVRDGPDGSLATVTEFMVNGSLKQFMQKKDRTVDRRKRLIIAMDAAFGMEYLHGKNIVHFDLKCENLLVNMRDPQRPVCKIGDLGLSKVKQHTLVSGGVRGTLPWMAPELLSGKSNMVSEKIDVYSFGIVLWELLTGDEPYADMHCASMIGGIVNNSLRPQIPTWCDPEWKALMQSCWASDPLERPSFSEISQKLRSMAAPMNVK
ncbi:Kinase family protein [Quillaja saponaria]|uniref:Kinase family protein n=1 Tax=Quillaja saponaria TaxID=32244 RepID=A0AAD7LCT7_QUISA|nr:Kinase family protein [Quillaja saponaria]